MAFKPGELKIRPKEVWKKKTFSSLSPDCWLHVLKTNLVGYSVVEGSHIFMVPAWYLMPFFIC